MSTKFILIGIFVIAAAAQIIVPLSVIVKWEDVLKNGTQYKIRTAPVDPYDAFRGRYVALGFDQNNVKVDDEKTYYQKENVFIILENDKDGYARPVSAQIKRPAGNNYLNAKISYVSDKTLYFDNSLDRYYMNEHDAPKAEMAYRKNSSRENRNAYVAVRVLNGASVIEKLYIDGIPVEEYIKKDAAK